MIKLNLTVFALVFWCPGGLTGLVVLARRRKLLKTRRLWHLCLLLAGAWACVAANRPAPPDTPAPAVLTAMQDELSRSMEAPSAADPPAYFISYTVSDRQLAEVSGSNGALLR